MADGLRAKFTLDLDDRMSPKARDAFGRFKKGTDDVVQGAKNGRDALGRLLPGLGDAGTKADGAYPKLQRFGRGLANVKKTSGDAHLSVRNLSQAIAKFNRDIEAGTKRTFAFNEASSAMKNASQEMAGMSRAALGLVEAPAEAAVGFQKAMTDIAVKADKLSSGELEQLRKKAMALGVEFGIGAEEVAKGVDVLSAAGWSKELVEGDELRNMLLSAKLGFSDFEQTAKVATGALAVYKGEGESTADMMLMLANAVNASKIGMDDLVYGLQDNMTVAKQAGLAYKDLLTMQGLLGQQNVKGGVANTATKNLAMMLQNPHSEAQKELVKLYGSKRSAKASRFNKDGTLKDIPGILASDELQLRKKGYVGQKRSNFLEAQYGRDTAGYAASLMTATVDVGASGKTQWEEMKAAITDTSQTQARFDTLMSSSAAQIDRTTASWQNFKIELGSALLPVINEVSGALTGILGWTQAFTAEHPTVTKLILYSALGFALLTGTAAAVLGVVGSGLAIWGAYELAMIGVAGATAIAKGAFLSMKASMLTGFHAIKVAALANPVTAIAIGIATAALLVYEFWDPISNFFSGLWDGVTAAFKGALDWILGKIQWASDRIAEMREYLSGDRIVDERKAQEQRATLAGLSAQDASRLQGLGGMVGETAARVRHESQREGAEQVSTIANSVRAMSAQGGDMGARTASQNAAERAAAGRGELLVKVSDDRVKVETLMNDLGNFALRVPRGSSA